MKLSFWHVQQDWLGDQDELRVYYKTSSGGAWTLLSSYTNSIANWTNEMITLPNLSNDYYIAFEGKNNYGWGIGLDNIDIICAIPTTTPINITAQPVDASICEGNNHTFNVVATGENLRYQWYKGNNPVFGANSNTLTLTNVTKDDYENYYVKITNNEATVISNKARLWVASPLNYLSFAKCPETATTGQEYIIKLAGYPDVRKYNWSFSIPGAEFKPESGKTNETTVIFPNSVIGKGTLTATLDHICGSRTLTQDITIKWPTGLDNIENNTAWVGPNPIEGVLTLDNGQWTIDNVIVTDLSGRVIFKTPSVLNSQLSINCSGWMPGIYMVKVTSIMEKGNKVKIYKVIKK